MIKLITGLPGAGKSLRSVQLLKEFIDAGRNVYVCGLDGLVDLGQQSFDHPSNWVDLPDGSVVVVDEAQKWWGTRRSAEPPEPIRALSEHRHRGFDFILVTQHPTMLDSYVRKLVGEHQHVLRQFGAQMSRLITWTECQDDPQSLATRQRGTEQLWTFPKPLYSLYKSATMHTVKKRIPLRLVLIPSLLVVAAVLGWFGYKAVTSIGTDHIPGAKAAGDPLTGGLASSMPQGPAKPLTKAEFIERVTPVVQHQPWSIPALHQNEVTAHPEIYCMSTPAKGSCTCLTEQGTRYQIDDRQCMSIARWGNYNPYRVAKSETSQGSPVQANNTLSAPVSAPSGSSLPSAGASSGFATGPSFNYLPPASR